MAAEAGHPECARKLIERGAELEAVESKNGWTPLYFAIYGNHDNCVELLIGAKAKIDEAKSKNYSQTPLMLAAYYGRLKSVELLLASKRCNPFVKDACGEMALHHAIRQGEHTVVKALLSKKEEIYREETGLTLTPIDCAMLTLVEPFPGHRVSQSDEDVDLPFGRKLIYNRLLKIQSNSRILAKTDDVATVTNVMLDCALSMAEAETKKKRKRHPFRYDSDSEDEDELLSTDDMQSGDICNQISPCLLPEFLSIGDEDVQMDVSEEDSESKKKDKKKKKEKGDSTEKEAGKKKKKKKEKSVPKKKKAKKGSDDDSSQSD